jgi:N-hydroxyarylamine O-acetyltransferase
VVNPRGAPRAGEGLPARVVCEILRANEAGGIVLSRYLRILGVPHREPGLAALAELTSAHLRRIPFENVSKLYHRADPGMRLPDLERFLDGIGRNHFGGTCYSNNFHFHELLAHLGYRVSLCGADMSAPDVHVVNTVDLAGRRYLVDVGYGAPFHSPLPLDLERDHEVSWGGDRYVLRPRDSTGRSRVDAYADGRLRHGYRVNPRPRRIEEFARVIAASFDEGATFMNAVLVARFFPGLSVTLRNLTLREARESGSPAHRTLGREALPAAVERYFGIPEAITRQALEGIPLTATV